MNEGRRNIDVKIKYTVQDKYKQKDKSERLKIIKQKIIKILDMTANK